MAASAIPAHIKGKVLPKRALQSGALNLDTVMSELSAIDKAGPLTATVGSPFLTSPIIASTLLISGGKLLKTQHAPTNLGGSPLSPSSPLVMHPVVVPVEKGEQAPESERKIFTTLLEGQVKSVAVSAFEDLLFLVRIAKWKVAYGKGEPFDRREQLPYFGRFDEEKVSQVFENLISEIWPTEEGKEAPKEATRARELIKIIINSETPVGEVVGALQKGFELLCKALDRFGGTTYSSFDSTQDAKSDFTMIIKSSPERIVIEWDKSLGESVLSAVTNVAQKLRDNDTDPSFIDYLVFHVAYESLRSGAKLDTKDARWLGTPGFRKDTQTYVSLTDPGEGHVFGTTRKARWLKGAICHVEHLERPGNLSRQDIESYRIPSIFEFARVRLHTGQAAPNTYFVGRRVKDSASGNFALDFIKVVNLTSAACSAAFQLGAAETKVAMDGLTASEALAYMRALSGHVLRNKKQVLSCAWNLNSPLIDDLADPDENGNYPILENNLEIGKRGIQLAVLGGFDKVTFDGAADTYPSYCVILQLTVENALELVHLAHQAGLTTYMSAGFKLGGHIGDAVYSGVDGIGIGGAQILRYMDGKTGHQGPYTEEFIDRIDEERDAAAQSIRGRGVLLLCRLDRMHFEGSITQQEDDLREPLYQALRTANEAEINLFLENPVLANIINLSDDGENPVTGTAHRLLRFADSHETDNSKQPLLLSSDGDVVKNKWARFTKDLKALIKQNDEEALSQYYDSQPWTLFREEYRKNKPELRQDRLYTIKATPHAPKDYATLH